VATRARGAGSGTDHERLPERVRDGGSFAVRYFADGRVWHGTIALTETSGFYSPGEAVTVIYDPKHPTDIRTPAEKNEPRFAVLPMILALVVGLIMLVGGGITLVRASRWRRLLASSPWRPYTAHYIAKVMRGRFQPMNPGLEVIPLDSSSNAAALLRMASTWTWRSDRMARHNGETIWLAVQTSGDRDSRNEGTARCWGAEKGDRPLL
jgi:hypothetical protein